MRITLYLDNELVFAKVLEHKFQCLHNSEAQLRHRPHMQSTDRLPLVKSNDCALKHMGNDVLGNVTGDFNKTAKNLCDVCGES